jgi:hypothetical protein
MLIKMIKCDICGMEKKEANHWYVASQNDGTFQVSNEFDRHYEEDSMHLCGRQCVIAAVNKYLEGEK